MGRYPYGEKDPFQHIGPVRIVLIKHNNTNRGKYRPNHKPANHVIVRIDSFSMRWRASTKWHNTDAGDWMNEEIQDDYNGFLANLVKTYKNGYYEIMADFYHHAWEVGYEEREVESDWELRNVRVQDISYKQATKLDNLDIFEGEAIDLIDKEAKTVMSTAQYVHQYMPEQMIYAHHAIALHKLYHPHGGYYELYKYHDMTIDQLKDAITMSMMMIDSESQKTDWNGNAESYTRRLEHALWIDEQVKYRLGLRQELFDPEDFDDVSLESEES